MKLLVKIKEKSQVQDYILALAQPRVGDRGLVAIPLPLPESSNTLKPYADNPREFKLVREDGQEYKLFDSFGDWAGTFPPGTLKVEATGRTCDLSVYKEVK